MEARRRLGGGGGGGGGGATASASSAAVAKRSAVEWVPLQKHRVFTRSRTAGERKSSSNSSNLAAWDAASSRFYLWDPDERCIHRLSIRFWEPDPASPSSSVVVEASSPSETLVPDIQIRSVVHHISLNRCGSSLILSGSDSLSLMHLYEWTSSNHDLITCRLVLFPELPISSSYIKAVLLIRKGILCKPEKPILTVSVGSQIYFSHNSALRTLQVSWHPYSDTHLTILSSDSVFRLFNLSSDLERPEQEYYLQPDEPGRFRNAASICPVAFSFGDQHLWERFSVFILYSDGSIYILCPVVPFGSVYSRAYIQEIYEDVNTFGLKSSTSKAVSNSGLAIAWLEATFPELANRSMDAGNGLSLRTHPYAPLDASLSLQGPLGKVCHGGEGHDSEAWSVDCEGKAVGLLYRSIYNDSVLVTAWSSGQLQVDALKDEVQPLWSIGCSPRLRIDSCGRIVGVAMICESNLQELVTMKLRQTLDHGTNSSNDTVWLGNPPPLLRLAIVDLALPKYELGHYLLSLFSDPLVLQRFYCLHSGGVDLIALHLLPYSGPTLEVDEIAKVPSVYPILSTFHNESYSPTILCGFVTVADSFGHSQIVGITTSYECIVLEMKGWSEMLPLHFDMGMKSIGSMETVIPKIISKELLSGPKAIEVPSSTTLRSMNADSIEGRSTLHHYYKLFNENYVEYAHKVYIELEQHGDHLKMIVDDLHTRVHEAKQNLLNIEAKEQGINDRINHAFQVYGLLEQRLQRFKTLPGVNKRPMSRAEHEFKSQLDILADLELDSLHSSIEALNARLRRYVQSSPVNGLNTPRRTPGRRKNHVAEGQISQTKTSLAKLSAINSENSDTVKLIEHELKIQEDGK